MTGYSIIGKTVNKPDAVEKVTGKAKYCIDMELPGMLYGSVLRSPYAHARIISIDTSKAEKLPRVRCVITGKDAPGKRYGETICDKHIIARNVVRFVGDPVAAVAADTIDIAREALDLIKVKYEQLPAIFDPEAAWSTTASVIVHPDLFNYQPGPISAAPDQHITFERDRPNVCKHYKIRYGDVDKGFEEADEIVENRFSTARIQACTLEPHDCIAQAESDGSLTVWSGRQLLYFSKAYLCGVFDLPPSKVRVISSMNIGGSFGSKSMFAVEPIAALLAQMTGAPVKIVLSREEVFCCGGTRIPMIIYMKDGVKRDGTLVAREARVILNAGAYAVLGPVLATNLTFAFTGVYRVPNVKIDTYAVYTNEPSSIAFRGFASSQPIWAIETEMDIIAERLGLDVVEIRKKNMLKEGEGNAHGEIMHSMGARQCLEKVVETIEWDKKPKQQEGPWKIGRGLAVGTKYGMPGGVSVGSVKVHEDGSLEVRHSADDFGQGSNTVMAQIAAEVFGISVDRVKVVCGDTDRVPFSTGTIAQGSTYNIGNGVRLAAEDAKRQVLAKAAEKMEVLPDDLETKDGKIYVKSAPSHTINIADLFIKIPAGCYVQKEGEIVGKGTWVQHNAPPDPETGQIDPDLAQKGLRRASFYGYAAQGAEVSVNVETGEVKVTKLIAACDMGQPINPKMCEAQMEGGMAMSLGSALWEEVMMDKGNMLNPNLRDYPLPTTVNMPKRENIKEFLTPVPHKEGPYGAKGMGETIMTPGAPAIGNAIYDAVGVRIKDLPITPEKVFKAVKETRKV